jgi:hypothetical protein
VRQYYDTAVFSCSSSFPGRLGPTCKHTTQTYTFKRTHKHTGTHRHTQHAPTMNCAILAFPHRLYQTHWRILSIHLGLARTINHIYIRCVYGISGREIFKYTVIYGVNIRFWPTLHTFPPHRHTFSTSHPEPTPPRQSFHPYTFSNPLHLTHSPNPYTAHILQTPTLHAFSKPLHRTHSPNPYTSRILQTPTPHTFSEPLHRHPPGQSCPLPCELVRASALTPPPHAACARSARHPWTA